MTAIARPQSALPVVAAPAALAAIVACVGLIGRSLGFDEAATVAIVSQHGSALRHAIAHDGGNMSGYYLLLHVLVGWLGAGPLVLRLPSVVFGTATAAVVAWLGLRLFDRRVALVAGVLVAVSLPLVFWAQSARGYAAMVAFTCAGYACIVSLADEAATPSRHRRLAVAGYVLAMALACYCSFVAVLVVPAQLLALVRRQRALRRFAGAVVALAVCCIPLAVLAVRRGSGQLFWVPRPSLQVEDQVLQSITGAGLQPSIHPAFTTRIGLLATLVALVVLAALAVRARAAGRDDGGLGRWPTALVLAWVAVPVLLTFAYSLVSQPVFVARNLLTVTPAVCLALAIGICHPRLPRTVALVALVAALLVRIVPVVAAAGVSPEPWQRVASSVLARSRPGDCVAFYPEDARNPFWYYVAVDPVASGALERAPRSILPAAGWRHVESFVERYATLPSGRLGTVAAGCRRLWLVSSHEGQTDGSAESLAHRAAYHALDAELQRAFGRAPIEQFGYASPIHVQLLGGR